MNGNREFTKEKTSEYRTDQLKADIKEENAQSNENPEYSFECIEGGGSASL